MDTLFCLYCDIVRQVPESEPRLILEHFLRRDMNLGGVPE